MHEAAAQKGDYFVGFLEVLHYAPPHDCPDLAHHPEDVALSWIGIGPHEQVGAAQHEKVCAVVTGKEGIVHQLANLARRRWWLNAINGVTRLGGGHVVCGGTHTTDALRDTWHLFDGASLAKGLKAAKLGHLKVGVGHVAPVVEEERDPAVPFQPRHRIDSDAPHSSISFPSPGLD